MLKFSAQLQLTAVYHSQNSSIEVNYICSTVYASPVVITITDGNIVQLITCSNGRFELSIDGDCGVEVNFCGNYTFENETTLVGCPLTCSNTVSVVCPSIPSHIGMCVVHYSFSLKLKESSLN